MGELTKSFTESFMANNTSIPWKKIKAMRNIAAHNYEAFDMQMVWETVKNDLLPLKSAMENAVWS
jgi:uncharacterized protein with HEPN domain